MSDHQTLLCRYHYDPLDRLAGHVAADEADTRLFYQKSHLATHIQGALHRSILQLDDQLLAQQQSFGKAVEATLLAADQQRSVLQSMGGGQHEALTYTPYGYLPMSSGLSSLLGFSGERRDPVTGHHLLGNGYRAFNPVLMRFNSPDSLSPFAEGGLNAYAYCEGDPVNYRDPTGHIKLLLLLARDTRSRMLRPISRLNRSITALQLPRTMVSPPSRAVGKLISKEKDILAKTSIHSLSKPEPKVAKLIKRPSSSAVRSRKPEPQSRSRVIENSEKFSYWQEDFRRSELDAYLGTPQPGAPFIKLERIHLLGSDDAAAAAEAVRS